MDKDLIEVYAHGNMLEALLTLLFVDILKREKEPEKALQAFRNDLATSLLAARLPDSMLPAEADALRQRGLSVADTFARKVAARMGYKVVTETRE